MTRDSLQPDLDLKISVAALLDAHPQAIPVLLKHGMACVGCDLSTFEAIGDAAQVYGLDPAALLREIQTALHDSGSRLHTNPPASAKDGH